MTLELISFKLCPYVQRSVITLLYLNQDFKLTYIDLENPPSWFDAISPLGRVPVLRVNSSDTIFESFIINEYIHEMSSSSLLSKDPLHRAIERSWIQFCGELLGQQYEMLLAKDLKTFSTLRQEFFSELKKVSQVASKTGPYFRGEPFTLVDTAFAPLFRNLLVFSEFQKPSYWEEIPTLLAWAKNLLQIEAVQKAVVPEFHSLYRDYLKKQGSYLANLS